jgi:hypothetical protein
LFDNGFKYRISSIFSVEVIFPAISFLFCTIHFHGIRLLRTLWLLETQY